MSKSSTVIVLEQEMVKSPAWLSLSGKSPQTYLLFRTKCQVSKRCGKPGRHDRVIVNNGALEFTYAEAKDKYRITHGQFVRALDQLIQHGFIDVTGTGMGVHKCKTTYAISERWREWTPGGPKVARPSPSIRNCGFRPGNKEFEKSKRYKERVTAVRENAHGPGDHAKFSSAISAHSAVLETEHGHKGTVLTNAHGKETDFSDNYWTDEELENEVAQVATMLEKSCAL